MKRIENVMYGVTGSSREAHKSLPIYYGVQVWGGGFLKRIVVINLTPTKDNEINTFHSDVQNHVSYTESYKRFLIFYGLCLETAKNVF